MTIIRSIKWIYLFLFLILLFIIVHQLIKYIYIVFYSFNSKQSYSLYSYYQYDDEQFQFISKFTNQKKIIDNTQQQLNYQQKHQFLKSNSKRISILYFY